MQIIKYPNYEFKNWKQKKTNKKTWKISESGGYFQILTHDNYEQTNGIQLELLQQTKGLTHTFFEKSHNFEIKSWKKMLKNLELIFQILNVK